LTLLAGGTANITASQGGDSSYNPAQPVTQTVTVIDDTLQPQTITFTQDLSGKTFGDADFDLTATVDSGLALTYSSSNAEIASIAGNTVTINGAGTVTITVSQPGNDDWQAATATKQLVISKADQTITFPAIVDKAVGDLDFDAGGSTDSGLAITYASSDTNVATVNGSKISLTGQGSVTITASQAGDATYLPASDVSQVLTVEAAPNEPNWPDVQTIWDDAISLGWEWYLLEWFGIFNSLKYPWVYHVDHGWLYFAGSDANNLWIWKSSHGWFWTSNESYPYVFLFDDMSWGWIAEDGFLFNYGTEEWENFSN